MTDDSCLAERRSLSSMFNVRRKSSSKLAPTLVVREEANSEMSVREQTPQARSVNSAGTVLSRNGSTLDNPTSDPNEDRRNLQPQPENSKDSTRASGFKMVTRAMFSATARKILCGLAVAGGVTISWVSGSHFVKLTYYNRQEFHLLNSSSEMLKLLHQGGAYDAPFLTTWLSTASLLLVFPVYSLLQCVRCGGKRDVTAVSGLVDCVRYFRDRGFTLGQFMFRTLLFCLLWVASSYLYFRSLRTLSCTDVAALFSTNVAFVYLLSWVILHQQFVGIRIVGMIMCNTGIALLAYMDGITNSPTLGTVVMAATGSAGLAVYKVCYRKVMGGYELGPVSLFFSLLSLMSSVLLWPLMLTLTLTGAEEVSWSQMPWPQLLAACLLLLICTLLCTLGSLVTYEIFATLGIILAVPLCAVVDLYWYNEQYNGMELAGMVLIGCGFVLVLFPNDWPSYIRTFIRCCRIHHGGGQVTQPEPVDYRTGVISRSRLRSPSGHVR